MHFWTLYKYVYPCVQGGVRPSGSTVSGCRCWALCVAWSSCSCWPGGRPSLPSVLSSSFWDTLSTRNPVRSHAYRRTKHRAASRTKQLSASAPFWTCNSVVRCKLGVLSAGKLLQHCPEPVCEPQPRGGARQELQVSQRLWWHPYSWSFVPN